MENYSRSPDGRSNGGDSRNLSVHNRLYNSIRSEKPHLSSTSNYYKS